MRTILSIFTLVMLLGCASPETTAYRVLGTTAHAVDGAMNGWGDWVRSGRAKPADEDAVRHAYAKYQAAMAVARAAVNSAAVNPDGSGARERALQAVDASRGALLALITALTQ